MTLADRLMRPPTIDPPALAALNRLEAAAHRVLARWPDVVPTVAERDRERLVQFMLKRLETDRWEGTKLADVTWAARVVFDAGFRDRPDLEKLRDFYFEETRKSTRPGFLSAMMSIYIASYVPGANHTENLASALSSDLVQKRLGARWRLLLDAVGKELLDPVQAPEFVAQRMHKMDDPWAGLKLLGLQSPHAPGLMDYAHLKYLEKIAPTLDRREAVDRLFGWLKPEGQQARSSGATEAIEALLRPWRDKAPSAELQRHLLERLVELYGDPRVRQGFPWGSVEESLLAIMMRWLTGENIRFFLDVISDTEKSHMWQGRHDFWLGLYDNRMIDAAWVAFSPAAERRASELRAKAVNHVGLAYGRQVARGGQVNTSLLVLKIGNCIVVEGSHNYQVHIFRSSNDEAPNLFKNSYDADKILRLAGAEKTKHIGDWQSRVLNMVRAYL